MLRGEGGAQSGEVIDTLLGDGALGVGKLVGFVGVEGASCGGFGGEILNISACVGDRGQWAAISRSMARQGSIGFVEGAAFLFGEGAGVALLFLQMGLLGGGQGVFSFVKLHRQCQTTVAKMSSGSSQKAMGVPGDNVN